MKKWILIIALLAGAFAAGILTGRGRKTPDIVEIRDTLTFHDTVFIDRPVPVYVTQIRTDTVRLALVDSSHTTLTRDSATVAVPITRKVYQDSTYRCIISGYEPELESLTFYPATKIVTVRETKTQYRNSRISLGVQAGYGVFGKEFSPYIGVGISYNIVSINTLKFK